MTRMWRGRLRTIAAYRSLRTVPLFRRKPVEHRAPQPGPFVVEAVAHVRNGVPVPRPHGWERVESEVVLLPEHGPRIEGIEAYSHVIIVFVLDVAADAPEKPEALTLASGLLFSEQLFGKPASFTHKTLFSFLGWLAFGILLYGRWRFGWRGRRALYWILAGTALLVLGYLGSKFVSEILLGR